MNELLNSLKICSGLVACILLAGILISVGPVKPALAQGCDKAGGTIGGAVIGGAAGSMFGRKKGRRGATIGGALIGGVLGSRRDQRAKSRCLREREVAKDRDMQRRLDYDRQRLLQEEEVRKEIEERRLFEEWKRQRTGTLKK
ncbi:MAG: glycine zipper 2TM domain-containing protein [Alphaproteobacteria bacterium]|nr:glycine zipper 2TM domain-containing protein [Alphaproteobacteria bacterium]